MDRGFGISMITDSIISRCDEDLAINDNNIGRYSFMLPTQLTLLEFFYGECV